MFIIIDFKTFPRLLLRQLIFGVFGLTPVLCLLQKESSTFL